MHTITVNQKLLNTLEKSNIFQARYKINKNTEYFNRFKIGDKIACPINTCIEEYTSFAHGLRLYSAGSFSSLASSLPLGSSTGRYTSLATGFREMGYRHPIESVCMNAISYDFGREHLSAYIKNYEEKNGTIIRKRVPTPQPQKAPITIGNDVWIGANVSISGGITIGNGAVIASNSIVTKDVEPYSLVAGIPAKHKKYRFPENIIQGLEEIKWWEYELGDIYKAGLSFARPSEFIEKFPKAEKNITKMQVKKFFPYLHNFSLPINPIDIIVDFHGNIIYFDKESNKLIQSSILRPDLLPVTLGKYQNIYFLKISDSEFIDIDENLKITITEKLHTISYKMSVSDQNTFNISIKNKYLSSQRDFFKWQPHLLEWEYFYTFS